MSTSVPSGGRLVLTLPDVMSVSTSSTLSCTFIEPALGSMTCGNVGNVVTITLSSSISASFFQLDIQSVVNPPSTTETDSFLFETQDASGTVLDEQSVSIVVQAAAGDLTRLTFDTSSNVVGESNTLTVSITLTDAIIAGGKVLVEMPKWNENAIVSSEILSHIQTGYAVTAITDLEQSTLTTDLAEGTSSDVLTISDAVPSDVAAGSLVSFSITNFLNPISTSTYSGYTVSTADSNDGLINTGTTTIRVTDSAAVYDTTMESNDTTTVQELAVFRIQFFVPVPLNTGCILDVVFPDDFQLSASNLTNVQGIGLFGGSRALTGSVNTGNNTYTISNGCTSYVSQDQLGIMDFSFVENPFTIKETESVSIFVKDSSQFSIAEITTGVTYSATEGTIYNVTLTPEVTTVSAETAITVTFLPEHELTATDTEISITLPDVVSITEQSDSTT